MTYHYYDDRSTRAKICKTLEGKVATLFFDGENPILEVKSPDETSYFRLAVFGECCSYSYWHEAANPEAVRNARIISIADVPVPEHDGEDAEAREQDECITSYCVRITTEKGICDLIFRNESNGYYGGDWCIELDNRPKKASPMEDGLLWGKS